LLLQSALSGAQGFAGEMLVEEAKQDRRDLRSSASRARSIPDCWITPEAVTHVPLPLRAKINHAACGERATPTGREQQRGAAMVGECFGERPSAAPLPHRLRKQHRDGAARRWSHADSRTVGAIQQSAVRGGTVESRPQQH
jgi:hypothetical protein